MKNILLCSKLILILLISTASYAADSLQTILMRPEVLVKGKQLAAEKDPAVLKALDSVIKKAETAMRATKYSVVFKSKVPPSGDKHDYMSVGPYWWPDSSKANGLPYIRKDGRINPERDTIRDAEFHNSLCRDVQLLSVAWYYTGKEKYATQAGNLLRAWFIDTATRMNPNLNYGQAIPGITDGRGIGLIDTHSLANLLDGMRLLKGSGFLKDGEYDAIQDWYRQFLHWMRTSPIGMDEADEHNNHGTWYDVQTVSIALFLDDKNLARKILKEQTQPRIESQLKADGSQPHELARTLSWNYSTMNLKGFFELARLAENVQMDLWTYETPEHKSLRKAFTWMMPYATEESAWKHQQIKPRTVGGYLELAKRAARQYPDIDMHKLWQQNPGYSNDMLLLTGHDF